MLPMKRLHTNVALTTCCILCKSVSMHRVAGAHRHRSAGAEVLKPERVVQQVQRLKNHKSNLWPIWTMKVMSNKEEYCFRVSRKYGLLGNFEGEPSKTNVPDPLEDHDETMAHRFKRDLGPGVRDVISHCAEPME